jgi:hypothetical protein
LKSSKRKNALCKKLLLEVGGVDGMTHLLLFHLAKLAASEKLSEQQGAAEHANQLIRLL